MDTMNRREVCVALSGLAALVVATDTLLGGAQSLSETQSLPETMAVPRPPGSAGDPVLTSSRAFDFASLPVVKTANGETRAVTRGVLATGEAIEVHETTLLPGHMPHPAHQHRHSEFMLVREGTMEFNNDGKAEVVGPGGVLFAASNRLHGLKNIGQTPANYFVIAIGRDTVVTPVSTESK